MASANGGNSAAANAATYAAAAQAYASAAQGAAQGIEELKASVAELTAEANAAAGALAKIAAVAPSGAPAGAPRGPAAPRKDPAIAEAEKRAKADAKAAEYVYQIKQRYLRQQEKDEAKAAKTQASDAAKLWRTSKTPAESVGERAVAGRSPWAAPPAGILSATQKTNAALTEQKAGAKGAAKEIAGLSKAGGASSPPAISASNRDIKLLAKNFGIGRAALLAPLVAGGLELTKLALGYKGMAQLDAITTRAGFNLRRLFKGVDATPAIRGVDRFLQVVNPASVTGKALAGVFERTFNTLFKGFETFEPVATAAFQGVVLGALLLESKIQGVEIGVLEAALAFKTQFPQATEAIEELLGPLGDLKADLKFIAGISLDGPFGALKKISDTVQSKTTGALRKAGVGKDDDNVAELLPDAAKPAGDAGEATGKAYTDGLVKGIAGGTDAVASAAGALAGVIDPKVRQVTDTHSPSRKAFATGEEQPAGLAEGIRSGIPAVSQAANDAGAASNSGTRSGASGAQGTGGDSRAITINMYWPEGVDKARRGEMQAAAEAGIYAALRAVNGTLAIPRGL